MLSGRDGKHRLQRGEYTVLLAFTGVDGALLLPPVPARAESFHCVQEVLVPYLEELQATRIKAGFSLMDSLPTFHSTDNYRRDFKGLAKVYKTIWYALKVGTEASKPKSSALHAKVMQWMDEYMTITGDPEHDIIAFRKLVPRKTRLKTAIVGDHADILRRLAAPLPQAAVTSAEEEPCEGLSAEAQSFLQSAAVPCPS